MRMKTRRKTRWATLLVALLMIFAMLPTAALADTAKEFNLEEYEQICTAEGLEYVIGEGVDPDDPNSPKPILSVSRIKLEAIPSDRMVTVDIAVSGANQAYCTTGFHIYYDDRLTIAKNKYGSIDVRPYADQEAGDQALAFTNNQAPKEDPTAPVGWKGLFVSTRGNGNVGLDGKMWGIKFVLPEDAKPGDVYLVEIWYMIADSVLDCFRSAAPNSTESKNMEAYVFTKGIRHGYIKTPEVHKDDWKQDGGFVWTGDAASGYTKAVANYQCTAYGYNLTDSAEAELKKEVTAPTCTAGGKTTYTASISADKSLDGQEYSESKDAEATDPDPDAHDWDAPTYEWSDDNKTVTATLVCKNDKTHVQTETVKTTGKVVKEATCTVAGDTEYTSAAFQNKAFTVQTKTVEGAIPATGHRWGTWKVTKESTATQNGEEQRVCENDGSHVETQVIPATGETEPEPEPQSKLETEPTVEPEPEPTKQKVSGSLLAKMTAKGSRSLVLKWSKIKGAEGYDIFFTDCGTSLKDKVVKKIKGNGTFTWTKTKLKAKKAYKAYVKAWVMENGKKKYVGTSPTVHAFTANETKTQTNAKSVTVEKTKITVKKGKTKQIKADVQIVKSKLTLMSKSHAAKLRYLSTNKKIATVSKSGKIRGVSKGSCYVYVYAHNGVNKRIRVTVK